MKRSFFLNVLQLSVVVFLLTATSLTSWAQYTDGYIVFVKGDTLLGQIDDQDWEVSPDHIYFKLTAESEPEKIEAEQVETFYIKRTNRRFVSRKIGIIDISKKNVFYSQPSLIPEKFEYIFLETVLQGAQASLYKLNNKDLEPHFYIETPSSFMELRNYSYYREIDGKQYVESREDYKKQLARVCSSAPNFKERIPIYTEYSLKKYLIRYNECFHESTLVYKLKKQRATYDVMAGLGMYLNPSGEGNWMVYTIGGRLNLPGKNFKNFLRATAMFIPGKDELGEKSLVKWTSISFGSYIGTSKFQPYFALGLIDLVFDDGLDGAVPLFVSTGISYRKMIEFEVGNWGNLLTFLSGETSFFPPCLSVRFYPNFFKNR